MAKSPPGNLSMDSFFIYPRFRFIGQKSFFAKILHSHEDPWTGHRNSGQSSDVVENTHLCGGKIKQWFWFCFFWLLWLFFGCCGWEHIPLWRGDRVLNVKFLVWLFWYSYYCFFVVLIFLLMLFWLFWYSFFCRGDCGKTFLPCNRGAERCRQPFGCRQTRCCCRCLLLWKLDL